MRYTKTETGITPAQDTPKIKVYKCEADVNAALRDGCFKTGEMFSIPVVNGIFDDLSGDIAEIKSWIPNSTTVSNQLTNVSIVQSMIERGTCDYSDCWTRLTNVETCANQNHSAIMDIGSVIPSNASSSNMLVATNTLTTCATSLGNRIASLESCPGLDYTGTVESATTSEGSIMPTSGVLDLTSLATKACADTIAANLSTLSTTVANHSTSISTLNTCTRNLDNEITYLKSCPGLNCTGTLVPSDLNSINSHLTNLDTCTAGHTSSIANLNTCTDGLNTRVTSLESCPGLNCIGNISSANFSLSGTNLTITIPA